jgi:tRNA 2-selenouridine synthase
MGDLSEGLFMFSRKMRRSAQSERTGMPKERETTKTFVRGPALVTVPQLSEFDEVIDVRSEGEFAEDHVPGAINCAVLDNEERARVGTIYKQQSSFEAKRMGAALVAANIARHLQQRLLDRQRDWRPLVYCWRGGSRSDAFAHVLHQVGWRVGRLDGGYRAYRRAVVDELAALPGRFRWRVICGLTGTGKSRLLRALGDAGSQVLDLEALAAHRGSVLGGLPHEPQPSQKMFESRVWAALKHFKSSRPVYVEAESRKIGEMRVPEALIGAMWASECVLLESPVETRVALLKQEYAHFFDQVDQLNAKLELLTPLHGHAIIDRWKLLARSGRWDKLTAELLARHYDPAYTRAIGKHYPHLDRAVKVELRDTGDDAFRRLAERLAHPA